MSKPDETSAVGTDSPKPLPGRHLAPRGERPNRWLAGLGVLSVLLVAVLVVLRASGVGHEPRRAAVPTSTVDVLGPPPPPPAGPAAFGNLVRNWSFEQDLRGWSAVGSATASRELQGRTSGSAAAVRVIGGGEPQRAGLVLLKAVPSPQEGSRYVASAWVRSTPPGLKVTLRLVMGGDSEASQAVTTTPPGDRWSRVTVTHTVAAAQVNLDLQIMAAGLRPGEALFVDEVELRRGITP